MEIERKYLIHKLPDHLEAYPHLNRLIYAPNRLSVSAEMLMTTS